MIFSPLRGDFFPVDADEFPCPGGIHGLFAWRRTPVLSHFARVRILFASRRAPIAMRRSLKNPMISHFENIKVYHD